MPKKYQILEKEKLTPDITRISVYAPLIAKKAQPGQFVILRVDEDGERIPLTASSCTEDAVSVVFQRIGAGTMKLSQLNVGDCLHDFVGPLGVPTEIVPCSRVAVVGGGLGCAIALPLARAYHGRGVTVDLIGGFRSEDVIILEDEMRAACQNLYICTDDGSRGYHGFVTGQLEELITGGVHYDRVYALGPLMMMKFVCRLTAKYEIPTIVSMNPLMIDGTGMCGCCRVTVDGQVKFACVDGPEFDGHKIDFDEVIARSATYRDFETRQMDAHRCRLEGMADG